jgi:hypothetical protein
MADGFFVLPRVGTGADDDPYRPKYLYDGDPPTLRSEIDRFFGSEEFEIPVGSGNYWFACRVYAASSDLTTLENQSDAYRIYPSDVETALNNAGIVSHDLTAMEWALVIGHFTTQPVV